MTHYLFKSPYRYAILGLILVLAALWYYWLKSDQIVGSTLLVYASGIALLNTVLAYFSYNRQSFVTKFLFLFSYGIIALASYALFTLMRGLS